MIPNPHLFFLHTKGFQPVDTELFPINEPLQIRIRFTEKFQLHLFKFPGPEGKVSGCNLITEGFSDLADTKRDLLA